MIKLFLSFLVISCFSCLSLKAEELPVLGKIDQHKFVDQNSETFSTISLNDNLSLAVFFFASCQGICPAVHEHLAEINQKYPQILILSVSVDPDNDTPQVLKEYQQRFAKNPSSWKFLQPSSQTLADFANNLGLSNGDRPEMHSPRVTLIDRKSNIRGYYKILEKDGRAELIKAIEQLN